MRDKVEDIDELKKIATQVRRDILQMVFNASSGHPGGSLGCADFMTALYFRVMTQSDEFKMDARMKMPLSFPMAISLRCFTVCWQRKGYFPVEELSTFRKLNTRLQGHPTTHEGLPGIRTALSGSLGQGFSVPV
ncbi:hypothetical protein [Candidatus Brachybacter algidus]|uniref:hypothetical protein n=1 Tax=Candidatus Brachybacter algidus TaxID=2982024 RepID=UPI00257F3643|nr:hypothetical protein [Candidatus Brachybacter algidus]